MISSMLKMLLLWVDAKHKYTNLLDYGQIDTSSAVSYIKCYGIDETYVLPI